MLNVLSLASRQEIDVLEMTYSGEAEVSNSCAPKFDVFLCHNSADKEEVRKLNNTLKAGGVLTWLDEDQIKPGDVWQDVLESTIPNIKACLVIVGGSGLGPWQDAERRAFISEFVNRGCRIIPVLIGAAGTTPQLPLFLKQFMWTDLRATDPREVARLISVLHG
jgi:hypothetical protein